MGAQMDRLMGLARYQVCRMKDLSDKFHLLNEEPECVNVCFWYIPKRFRGKELNKEVQAELGKVIHFSHFSFFFLFSFCNSLFVLFYCAVWVYISTSFFYLISRYSSVAQDHAFWQADLTPNLNF